MQINKIKILSSIYIFVILGIFLLNGCNKNSVESNDITDDEFLKNVVLNGYSQSSNDEDNLTSQEYNDLNDGGPVSDNEGGMYNPVDSLKKWGRIISDVNVNINIDNEGDSLKNVLITRTISGNYVILGYQNGTLDTIRKPYTEVTNRKIVFKRINNYSDVRRNWRLYKIGVLDGGTTQPQIGSSKVRLDKVEVFLNGSGTPSYTFNRPDFQNIMFTTRYFGGSGIPVLTKGSQVKVKVYTTSQNSSIDYVAWHWARNSFGFHRIPFTLVDQSGSGPYLRTYEKTFNIYNNHIIDARNGYLSASSHESLYDDNVNELASDMMGLPYWILQ